MSEREASLKKENAERLKKILMKDNAAFYSQNHDAGEAAKREEAKVQADNFWTRLWGKMS